MQITRSGWYLDACSDTAVERNDIQIYFENEQLAVLPALRILDTEELIEDPGLYFEQV